jgi:hypothetical protein
MTQNLQAWAFRDEQHEVKVFESKAIKTIVKFTKVQNIVQRGILATVPLELKDAASDTVIVGRSCHIAGTAVMNRKIEFRVWNLISLRYNRTASYAVQDST